MKTNSQDAQDDREQAGLRQHDHIVPSGNLTGLVEPRPRQRFRGMQYLTPVNLARNDHPFRINAHRLHQSEPVLAH